MEKKTHKEKERIFKSIPELDSEIRTIQEPMDLKSSEPFIIEIGVFESLGEIGGDILTWEYDEYPTEELLKEDIRKYLRKEKQALIDTFGFSSRDEMQLKAINKLKLN
jgi:hypothetical protein